MERVKGIEPSQPAWKAGALPLSYTRIYILYLKNEEISFFIKKSICWCIKDALMIFMHGNLTMLAYSKIYKFHTPNKNGAEDEIRTRDPRLGKAMLYHWATPAYLLNNQNGGGDWIWTSESVANGFTVRPLWPTRELLHIYSPKGIFGAGERTWTPNLLITSQLLYQLSYTSIYFEKFKFTNVCSHITLVNLKWRPGRDSNPRPPAWQAGILTNWTTRPMIVAMNI